MAHDQMARSCGDGREAPVDPSHGKGMELFALPLLDETLTRSTAGLIGQARGPRYAAGVWWADKPIRVVLQHTYRPTPLPPISPVHVVSRRPPSLARRSGSHLPDKVASRIALPQLTLP